MRRAGLLGALLVTAALLCAMPGLVGGLLQRDANRMDQSLRPAESRTLTLWLIPGDVEDGKLVSRLCAAFEKAEKGLRVFLRKADAEELYAPDAVLPDGVLFTVGDVPAPEKCFLPLAPPECLAEDRLASGRFGGALYAAPLWLSPNVASLPADWPLPEDGLPWREMLKGLWIDPGVCWQQALFLCPVPGELAAASLAEPAGARARLWPLARHQAAVKAGERLTAAPLSPAVSHRARYLALCRDGEDGRRLLRFFLGEAQREAYAFSLLPLSQDAPSDDPLWQRIQEVFANGFLLPNAFAHTKNELTELCRDGFSRLQDPVETLLKLR